MSHVLKIKLLLSILFLPAFTLAQSNREAVRSIDYVIVPISVDDRVNLEIEMTFTGDKSGTTLISLPVDRYGTRNIYESVSALSVKNAQVNSVFQKPHLRILHHDPGEQLVVTYIISFDPEMSSTSSFSPVIESEIFHFFYSQWVLRIEGKDDEHFDYSISFREVPEEWVAFSNISEPQDGNYSFSGQQKDFKPFIAGGKFDHYKLDIQGKPVNVIISYHFKGEKLLEDVRVLLSKQRQFFDFDANQHYLVSITYREGIRAGTAIENAFVTLLEKGSERYEVLQLLAHETMHNWIPLMADIERNEDEVGSEYSTEFFNEGFINYAPRVLLYNEGLISKEEVVLMLNETLEDYARNPHRKISLEEIKKAEKEGTFNNWHEKISYYRGDLMALIWDNQIREATYGKENILHFIKKVISAGIEENGKIDFQEFFELASEYGIDGKKEWERYILKGEMISLNSLGWLEDDYKVIEEEKEFFSEGFRARESRRSGIVTGVVTNGAAYQAGLRNGMQIKEITVSRTKDRSMVIEIEDQGGERVIEYMPAEKILYQKIVPR